MKVLTLHQPWASLVAPLAIHAAARKPEVEMMEDGLHGEEEWGQWFETAAGLALAPDYDPVPLPLGAIVATCTLADVVPILRADETTAERWLRHVAEVRGRGVLRFWDGEDDYAATPRCRDIEDQRPYGDFTPGRYAYLLADAVHLPSPVPFKGGQRLTKTWRAA